MYVQKGQLLKLLTWIGQFVNYKIIAEHFIIS